MQMYPNTNTESFLPYIWAVVFQVFPAPVVDESTPAVRLVRGAGLAIHAVTHHKLDVAHLLLRPG